MIYVILKRGERVIKDSKGELKDKLREIFQFESKDLDFGIYRIMNYKRKEIERFIEKELIEEIKKQLTLLSEEEKKKIKEKLEEIASKNGVKKYLEALEKNDEERARIYKEDFARDIEEYEKLKRQLEEIKISEDLEKRIYNHIINFFTRYYDNGDFISKRRYGKHEKYIIPYNGEEVLFYWTNKDQYYIKTTEYFKRYTFKVKNLTVNFRVIKAEEEKSYVKAQEKKFFVLNDRIFNFNREKQILDIYFEYRALTDEEKERYCSQKVQDKINEEIISILKEKIPENSLARLIFKKEGDKTLIEKHLYKYTRRNTTDYFIHKNLKRFLERELDFYIKSEFLQLEDLQILEQSGYFDKLKLYLIGARVFRNIALKIIELLAQIENFQKKIWEKKKFVIDTHYVITLDKIKEYAGEEFLEKILDEILKNKKQLKEWRDLFGVDIKEKRDLIENITLEGKEWKKLPIDTRYFGEEFKWKLLVAISEKNDLDDILDGVLIKSENWQALNLLLNKYRDNISTIYIDPPYNTGSDDFLYKDNYQHSSWLTMMKNRLSLAKELMSENGVIFISIDDNELFNLNLLSKEIGLYFISNFIRRQNLAGKMDAKFYATEHDYVISFSKNLGKLQVNKRPSNLGNFPYKDEFEKTRGKFRLKQLDDNSIRYSESLDYPICIPKGEVIYFWDEKKKKEVKKKIDTDLIIYPGGDPEDKTYTWRWSEDKVRWGLKNRFIVFRQINGRIKVYFKQYQLVDNELKPILREIPFGTLILNFPNNLAPKDLGNLFGNSKIYLYPKPVNLIKYVINLNSKKDSIILDFFAGSGTTAHAVMELNKEDNGKRKFLLVELADYFDTIIIPRIKKVAYSFDWKNGEPQSTDGIGVFFKYHTLEQYEDALENIEFKNSQLTLYELSDYLIKYMLEWETKKSKTFLNIEEMQDPFNYKLKIIENYKQKIVNVDLVETFNYLIGLHVKGYKVLEENSRKYVFVFGKKGAKRIVVVWRSVKNIDFEKDKKIIEENVKNFNPDEIYINGDSLVKEFRHIEPVFKSLMFEEAK